MRTVIHAIGVTSLVGLVFLLSACGRPEPGKSTTAVPPQRVVSPPGSVTPSAPSSVGAPGTPAPVVGPTAPGTPTNGLTPPPTGKAVPGVTTSPSDGGRGWRGEPAYHSAKPRYARLALTADRSKILSVVFDESNGTGQGYDIVYADVNFNGRFEQEEAVKPRTESLGGAKQASQPVSNTFPPINLNLPYNEKGKGIPNPCSVAFNYMKYSGKEEFLVTAGMRLAQDSTQWRYLLAGYLKPSQSLGTAAVWGLVGTPTLTITTKPDLDKKGNLGIELAVVAGDTRIRCTKGKTAPDAHLVIRNPQGDIVRQDTAPADKFAFG